MEKNIMEVESVLPEDFDGTFRFTNNSDEDFVGVWDKKEYVFPARTTSPMIMSEYSPVQIQYIRKKFAKDYAERELFKSQQYKGYIKQERNPDGSARLGSINAAAQYSLNELAPFIQECLLPLKGGKASVKDLEVPRVEEKLSRNDSGELNTEAIDSKKSLRKKALES